jgi:hypothetical protein
MAVGIVEARKQSPILEVDKLRIGTRKALDFRRIPDGNDLSLPHGNGFGFGFSGIHGDYVGVNVNLLGS